MSEHARYLAVADQHPGQVGIVGESVNEHGTPVSVLRCSFCETVASICPPTTPEAWGAGCLGESCASYDLERDMDIFWEPLMDSGLVEREGQ